MGLFSYLRPQEMIDPGGRQVVREKPYEKYSFSNLVSREDQGQQFEKIEDLPGGEGYRSFVFQYFSEGKKITGQLNEPLGGGVRPAVILLRGYVDPEVYYTGLGTKNAAAYYAKRGFVTIAPDFLGYAGSDEEEENSLGARVVKLASVLDLVGIVTNLDGVDEANIFLWGHSNGGQIGISALEVLDERARRQGSERVFRAATLWAPVTKPFPYSILYYTDESDDGGKALRQALAVFEREYDAYDYSIDRYWDWIATPIVVHQGTADEAVPREWSHDFAADLKDRQKEVELYIYPGANHNLTPGWDLVVERDLAFFQSYMTR